MLKLKSDNRRLRTENLRLKSKNQSELEDIRSKIKLEAKTATTEYDQENSAMKSTPKGYNTDQDQIKFLKNKIQVILNG